MKKAQLSGRLSTKHPILGFETIGNACLICFDGKPILATDPWIQGSAYFGSWCLSHEVPQDQRDAVLECPYIWFSHGHPDHLNPDCIALFKGKKILLPDHVGGRIHSDLKKEGYDVQILPDRKWFPLSDRIKVLCIADIGQDAVLLVDINGRLVVNTNDCGHNGWERFVRRIVSDYELSFLMCLSGYGDTDMINFFDENGKFITPEGAQRPPIGPNIAEATESFGAKYFVPFSSMHKYQRSDSVWANQYVAHLEDYSIGFKSEKCEMLPAFLRYDCGDDTYSRIDPRPTPDRNLPPSEFGDDWSDRLEKDDIAAATRYFQAVESLPEFLDFLTLRVGGQDHRIPMGEKTGRGLTFEAPRASLMTAIRYEIFDDMLIGNFMKTTLHGAWPASKLNPFSGSVCKWGDNGRARTHAEVEAYIKAYERRSLEVRLHQLQVRSREAFIDFVGGRDSMTFRWAKRAYHLSKRKAG